MSSQKGGKASILATWPPVRPFFSRSHVIVGKTRRNCHLKFVGYPITLHVVARNDEVVTT